jgi:two-component system phosphate regulon response regulator PhoB
MVTTGTPRILVVDDDPDMRVFLATVLAEGGFEPTVADCAEEGLKQATSTKPALILLDAQVPLHSSCDMYRLLKEDPSLQAIPVIMLSVLSSKTYRHYRKLEEGRVGARLPEPDGFLGKPPEAEDLLRRIDGLLAGPTANQDSFTETADGRSL